MKKTQNKTEEYHKNSDLELSVVDAIEFMESSITTYCYICSIDVATAHIQEHNASRKHENYKKIFKKVFEIMSQCSNTDVLSSKSSSKPNNSYYCGTCCQLFDINVKDIHETSISHLNLLKNDKIVENFTEIFCNTVNIQSNQEIQRDTQSSSPGFEKTDDASIYFDITNQEEIAEVNFSNLDLNVKNFQNMITNDKTEINLDCNKIKMDDKSNNINDYNVSKMIKDETSKNLVEKNNNYVKHSNHKKHAKNKNKKKNSIHDHDITIDFEAIDVANSEYIDVHAQTYKSHEIIAKDHQDTKKVDYSSDTECVEYIIIQNQEIYDENDVKINSNINIDTTDLNAQVQNNNEITDKTPELDDKTVIKAKNKEVLKHMKIFIEKYNLQAPEFHEDCVIIDKEHEIKVSLDNYNSYKHLGDTKYCQLCHMWVQSDNHIHDLTERHMINVLKPITEQFFRIISKYYSHCLLCNEVILGHSDHHVHNQEHKDLLDKLKTSKINNSVFTNTKMCEVCNHDVRRERFGIHLRTKIHKNRLISQNILDFLKEITVSEFFERIFTILLIIDKNAVNFCNVCKKNFFDFNDHLFNTTHESLCYLKDINQFREHNFCYLCVVKVSGKYVKIHYSDLNHINSYKNYIESYLSKCKENFDESTKEKIREVLYNVDIGGNCLDVIELAKELIQFQPKIDEEHKKLIPKDNKINKNTEENINKDAETEILDNTVDYEILELNNTIEMINNDSITQENVDLDLSLPYKTKCQNKTTNECHHATDVPRDEINVMKENNFKVDLTDFKVENCQNVAINEPEKNSTDLLENSLNVTEDKHLTLATLKEQNTQNARFTKTEQDFTNSERERNQNTLKKIIDRDFPKAEFKNVPNLKNYNDVVFNENINNENAVTNESNDIISLDVEKNENTVTNINIFDFHKCYEKEFGFYCECCMCDINDFMFHINTNSHVLKLADFYYEQKQSNFLIDSLCIDDQGNYIDTNNEGGYIFHQFIKNLKKANGLYNFDEISYVCSDCDHLVWKGRAIKHIFSKKHRRNL